MGKQTKVKNAKKVMAFFGLNFDLHPPYNVLGNCLSIWFSLFCYVWFAFSYLLKFSVDPEIIHLALSRKVFIKEAIPELLRGKAHLGKWMFIIFELQFFLREYQKWLQNASLPIYGS